MSAGNLSTLAANDGSFVNISGGCVSSRFRANDGSQVNISGGAFTGAIFSAGSGSEVELCGGNFCLNGEAFTGQTITLGEDDVFTGTLADSSSFIFSGPAGDEFSEVSLREVLLPELDLAMLIVDSLVAEKPKGLGLGQPVTLVDGGSLPGGFPVIDSTLNVQGGTLGSSVETAGGVVNISGGNVGPSLRAHLDSEVNVSGGTLGDGPLGFGFALVADSGSVVNVSGGTVYGLQAESGSVVNISGGTVDIGIQFAIGSVGLSAESGSEVNISGGTVTGFGVTANEGSTVNITGTQFVLNGELLDALVVGESFTITEPVETLDGVLADGSPFSFGLDEFGFSSTFSPGATITVTLSSLLGDVSGDGVVDFLDIGPFVALLSAGDFQFEADIDSSGVVDFLDVGPFIRILSEQ